MLFVRVVFSPFGILLRNLCSNTQPHTQSIKETNKARVDRFVNMYIHQECKEMRTHDRSTHETRTAKCPPETQMHIIFKPLRSCMQSAIRVKPAQFGTGRVDGFHGEQQLQAFEEVVYFHYYRASNGSVTSETTYAA